MTPLSPTNTTSSVKSCLNGATSLFFQASHSCFSTVIKFCSTSEFLPFAACEMPNVPSANNAPAKTTRVFIICLLRMCRCFAFYSSVVAVSTVRKGGPPLFHFGFRMRLPCKPWPTLACRLLQDAFSPFLVRKSNNQKYHSRPSIHATRTVSYADGLTCVTPCLLLHV